MKDPELGAWLCRQREDLGLTKAEMARQLVKVAHEAGDRAIPSPEGMERNLLRWEREGGVSERYRLYFCRILRIHPSQFGPHPNPLFAEVAALGTVVAPPLATSIAPMQTQTLVKSSTTVDTLLPTPISATYRGERPDNGRFTVEHEVMMAAHESSDHAAEREQHGIGELTFEQLRTDVMRISRLTDSGAPLPTFMEARRVRDRIYRLLDRQLWPREQADLYFLLGCINALMGLNANQLGYPDAAEELLRSGWAYANAIDHNPLRGKLRATLSYVNYFQGRYREASNLAVDGLRYASEGPLGADLHLNHARAAARLGEVSTARQAVGQAQAARDSNHRDDLMEMGGNQFAQHIAMMHTLAGGALIEAGVYDSEVSEELEQAISLYNEVSDPGEEHPFDGKANASSHIAVVRLRSGALEGAVAALAPILAMPPAQRVTSITARLVRVREELAAPVFRHSLQARDLNDQIEQFGREAITAGLHSLSG